MQFGVSYLYCIVTGLHCRCIHLTAWYFHIGIMPGCLFKGFVKYTMMHLKLKGIWVSLCDAGEIIY